MKKTVLLLLTFLCMSAFFSCDFSSIPFLNDNDENSNNTGDNGNGEQMFTVTFDSAGGTTVGSQTIKPGEYCVMPSSTPFRDGAIFDAWYYKGKPFIFKKNPITEDITLVAKWKLETYNIQYNLSGGQLSTSLPTSYTIDTDTIVLTEPKKGDYKFAGWYLNGKLVTEIPKGTIGDLLLVADFYGPDATVLDSSDATVRTWDNDTSIEIKLTASSTDVMTVKVNIPKEWHTVQVIQGKTTDYVTTYTEGDKLMLDIKMTPGDEKAVLTPAILNGETELVSTYGTIVNGKKIDVNYFPGFVRKTITFSIDDGDIANDPTFLSIVRPAGILGTFNLKDTSATTAAKLLILYDGYEIASHHMLHCLPENEKNYSDTYNWDTLQKMDAIFNSSTANPQYMYKSSEYEGLWYIATAYWSNGVPPVVTGSTRWDPVADNATYIKYADLTKTNLEKVFGLGSVVGFAAPHGEMNETIRQYLKDNGYLYMRKAGSPNLGDTDGDGIIDFDIPADRYSWNYNAWHSNLNDLMAQFDALNTGGELKMFSFGVHAVDYKDYWDELRAFADKYGNRSDKYWYATNREIFEYQDAINTLEFTSDSIINSSSVAVFITVDNVKTIIPANSTYSLK